MRRVLYCCATTATQLQRNFNSSSEMGLNWKSYLSAFFSPSSANVTKLRKSRNKFATCIFNGAIKDVFFSWRAELIAANFEALKRSFLQVCQVVIKNVPSHKSLKVPNFEFPCFHVRFSTFNFLPSKTNMGCCYVVDYEGINNGQRHIALKVPNIEKIWC